MKLTLDIDLNCVKDEDWILLGKITDRELFPLKSNPSIELSKWENKELLPDFLQTRATFGDPVILLDEDEKPKE